jgi:hypothetical protein
MSNPQTPRPDSTRGAVARARCAREISGCGPEGELNHMATKVIA